MEQKVYQKLRKPNLKAAKAIYEVLKEEKTISAKRFSQIFFSVRTNLPSYGYYKNWETTLYFLKDHELMTSHTINDLKVYVATQKCIRTHSFENATREYQTTTYELVGKAMEYQKLNNGRIDPLVEGEIIAGILGFEGNLVTKYAKKYAKDYTYHMKYGDPTYIRYAVKAPCNYIPEIKVLD